MIPEKRGASGKILQKIGFFAAFMGLLFLFLFRTVNRDVSNTAEALDVSLELQNTLSGTSIESDLSLQAAWSSRHITPREPSQLIGYKVRGPHEAVLDSLYLHMLLLQKESQQVAMVNLDLLMVPADLRDRVEQGLQEMGSSLEVYWTATHTHSSFGGWEDKGIARWMTGEFDENVLASLELAFWEALAEAKEDLQAAEAYYLETKAGGRVENRLDREVQEIDDWLRGLEIIRADSSKGTYVTFGAHPSLLSKQIHAFSADYPGYLVKELRQHYDFAMFGAGAVASQRPREYGLKDAAFMEDYGKSLAALWVKQTKRTKMEGKTFSFERLPVQWPPGRLRLSQYLEVRPWFFELLMGELLGDITLFRIGEVLFIGMPADFSGELALRSGLYAQAKQQGLFLVITSFNGRYVGYLTDNRHFDSSPKDEVRTLNWVGFNGGAFIVDLLLERLARFNE